MSNPPTKSVSGADQIRKIFDDLSSGDLDEPISSRHSKSSATGGKRRRKQSDAIVDLVAEDAELWHDPDGNGYATMFVNGAWRNWPLRSPLIKSFISMQVFRCTAAVPRAQALEDSLKALEGLARFEAPEHETFIRVAGNEQEVYVDLGDENWNVVKITREGWRVVERAPVKFIRSSAMRALPVPETEDSGVSPIERLKAFLNFGSDENFRLALGWLVGAYRPKGPYPLLILSGEQGAGKSSFSRLFRSLVDPAKAPIRSAPRDERDLIIAARNSWCPVFDNLSHVPNWLSDSLCRLSTGGGFSSRELYSNWDEVVFEGRRPIILNGIPELANRPDLGDRAIAIHLPAILEKSRRSESELEKQFSDAAPFILGGIFDGVSSALRRENEIELSPLPRMADFCVWASAAESGFGWPDGSFAKAYAGNRNASVLSAAEADPIIALIQQLVENSPSWTGTATNLLHALEEIADEKTTRSRYWPKRPESMRRHVDRIAPILRSLGTNVQTGIRESGADRKRLIVIESKKL